MAKSEEPDNYRNCLDLLEILRQAQRVRLGIPKLGEHIVIEYIVEDDHPQLFADTYSSSQPHQDNPTTLESLNPSDLPSSIDFSDVESLAVPEKSSMLPSTELSESSNTSKDLEGLDSFEILENPNSTKSQNLVDFSNSNSLTFRSHSRQDIEDYMYVYFNSFDRIGNLYVYLEQMFDDVKIRERIQKFKNDKKSLIDKIEELVSYCEKKGYLAKLATVIEQQRGESADSLERNSKRQNERYEETNTRVFISYSWDSKEHKERVLRLADTLREKCGLDADLDRYVRAIEPYTPERGWDLWMQDKIKWADFVLIVCTEIYKRRFEGEEEPGQGLGLSWEGTIIRQDLYSKQLKDTKFIPIIFSQLDSAHVPQILYSKDKYNLHDKESYKELIYRLSKKALLAKPTIGKLDLSSLI